MSVIVTHFVSSAIILDDVIERLKTAAGEWSTAPGGNRLHVATHTRSIGGLRADIWQDDDFETVPVWYFNVIAGDDFYLTGHADTVEDAKATIDKHFPAILVEFVAFTLGMIEESE